MFGNRKRQRQDDEESLVPHGLIWHATAEPAREENATTDDSLGHTAQFAQLLEQTRRPQPAPEKVDLQAAPQESSAEAAPLPWWRLQRSQPEPNPLVTVKPAPFPLSEYGPTPIRTKAPQPGVPQVQSSSVRLSQVLAPETHLSPVPQPRVAEVPAVKIAKAPITQVPATPQVQAPQFSKPQGPKSETPALTAKRSADALLQSLGWWLRTIGQVAWRSILSTGEKISGSWLRISRSLELRETVLRAGKRGQDLFIGGVAQTSRYAQTAGSSLAAFSQQRMARLRRMSARINSTSTTATTTVLRPANTQPSSSRVRVLLAASGSQAKVLLAEQRAKWNTRRDNLAIDSRFWRSMTMAAIAALITLAIVSLVPQYAAKSLPSRIQNTNPSVNTSAVAPAVLVTPTAEKTPAPKTATPKIAQEKPAAKLVSTKSGAPPKAHRTADDDYVAPDTYKYYGHGSKASR